MGLFRTIGRIAQKVVAPALAAGHVFTGGVARFAPGVVGLKSPAARAMVNVTQGAMLAGGAAALGGSQFLTSKTMPMGPRDRAGIQIVPPNAREAQVEQFVGNLLNLVRHHL